MPQCLPCLPFLLPTTADQCGPTSGIAHIREDCLVLQFPDPVSRCGQTTGQKSPIRLPLNEISTVSLQPDWLSSALVFTLQNSATLPTRLTDRPTQLILQLSRQDQPLAEQWVNFLQQNLNTAANPADRTRSTISRFFLDRGTPSHLRPPT